MKKGSIGKLLIGTGGPFTYYYQFWLRGSEYPNSGGSFMNLLFDILVCWLPVTGIYLFAKRNKTR